MKLFGNKSIKLHRKHKGKIATILKWPIASKVDLAIAYTPGVAEICKIISKDPKKAKLYTIKNNTVGVISDGSAVLGLGNIGPLGALPVMEGKAALLKRFANIDAFPICLDTQDPEEIIRTVKIIAPVFGAIQLEDISAPRCFEIEKRLQSELDIPVLHDDQHSTAVVVLAALINSLKVRDQSPFAKAPGGGRLLNKLMSTKIIINGAGAAGIGIAGLLSAYGFKNLIMLDSQGAIYQGRHDLTGEKETLAKITNPQKIKGDLSTCLKNSDIFIGVSKSGLLKPEMIKQMNSHPIIFALANPEPEIMPREAKKAGAYIVATGRSDFENQINNVLAFPGMFRGMLDNNVRVVSDAMLIKAAESLTNLVKSPTPTKILPDVFDKKVVKIVANSLK